MRRNLPSPRMTPSWWPTRPVQRRRAAGLCPRGPWIWDLKTATAASPTPIPAIEQAPLKWISADGRLAASLETNFAPWRCWNLQSGKELPSIGIQDDRLRPLAYRAVGRRLHDNPVATTDGKWLLTLYASRRQESQRPAAAPKNARVSAQAAAAKRQLGLAASLGVHEIETGRPLFDMDLAGMTFVGVLAGTNKCVCEAADGTISFRDLKTGKELRRATLRPTSPSRDAGQSVAAAERAAGTPQLTPDGKQLVKPVFGGGFVLFDLASGAEIARFKSSETGRSARAETLVLAPSGRTAAVYSERDIHLWTLPVPAARPADVAARKPEAPPLERKLAATATAVAVGGAGRFLLFTLDQARASSPSSTPTPPTSSRPFPWLPKRRSSPPAPPSS